MKHNILFSILTAAILILGFYAMDIAEGTGIGKTEENVILRTEKTAKQAYLSAVDTQIKPMKLVETADAVPLDEKTARSLSAMVELISGKDPGSLILWGIRGNLASSLRLSKNGYIFVNGWEYINKKKSRCMLDCIFDAETLELVYIRFYSAEPHQPTADEMTRALEKIDSASKDFYPDIVELWDKTIEQINNAYDFKDELEHGINYEDIMSCLSDNFAQPDDENDPIVHYSQSCKYVMYVCDSLNMGILEKYWFPMMTFSHTVPVPGKNTGAVGISDIFERLLSYSDQYSPEYSAYGDCIYQTIHLGEKDLTIFFSAESYTIEGFYLR